MQIDFRHFPAHGLNLKVDDASHGDLKPFKLLKNGNGTSKSRF